MPLHDKLGRHFCDDLEPRFVLSLGLLKTLKSGHLYNTVRISVKYLALAPLYV